ncbi:hypothetical protein C8Q73DRAFT_674442 [Cubamyces lactineus]|nr:hypothetical protein C8Q73DRAFT_674442 [Cubamyces lactineus]
MSSPIYPHHTSAGAGPSSSRSSRNHYHRPATIAELAAQAQQNLWDPNIGLKHWLRTAEKARRLGDQLVKDNDYEGAFVEYAKAATIVLEKLPTHREYDTLLNADQRSNLGMVSLLSFYMADTLCTRWSVRPRTNACQGDHERRLKLRSTHGLCDTTGHIL